ncbi:MDR family MFS transporter [Zhouia sp. PK063]|uniref:MDR family MFS transporter n=1 Tax=Zhouia sp. PK063 TaxID=3373602 RepID=UPI0037BCD382
MKKLYYNYIDAFKGLSKEVWWLALITLINRAGTMVIPFLSLYLKENLHFTLDHVGWIMTCFGLGSLAGSYLGGWLTDKIGYYKVMTFSLLGTGIAFIILQFLDSFWGICIGIFSSMFIADSFRPAVFVALSTYSKPENKTRSVTLIRLAINLGFSAGPAVGGFIITHLNYSGLFWVDGITCIISGFLLLNVLHPKKAKILDQATVTNTASAYSDKLYWLFFAAMALFGFAFLQYFSTMPLYYDGVYKLTEDEIGLILGLNGLTIFLFEMPLVKYLETRKWSNLTNVFLGSILTGISFLILILFDHWIGLLIIGMLLVTFGEMIVFPFSNAFALERAKGKKQGQYMALYSISFSVSHIFSHNTGLHFVDAFGFNNTWKFVIVLSLLCSATVLILIRGIRKEKSKIIVRAT